MPLSHHRASVFVWLEHLLFTNISKNTERLHLLHTILPNPNNNKVMVLFELNVPHQENRIGLYCMFTTKIHLIFHLLPHRCVSVSRSMSFRTEGNHSLCWNITGNQCEIYFTIKFICKNCFVLCSWCLATRPVFVPTKKSNVRLKTIKKDRKKCSAISIYKHCIWTCLKCVSSFMLWTFCFYDIVAQPSLFRNLILRNSFFGHFTLPGKIWEWKLNILRQGKNCVFQFRKVSVTQEL